jgi:dTDP-4-dehydrorhamnose reductase
VYGQQKAQTERLLLSERKEQLAIVRLTKVIHPAMPLLQNWATALHRGETIHPYFDMTFSPLPLDFVVRALHSIAARRQGGVIHLSAESDLSYATLAKSMAAHLRVRPELVQPRPSPGNPPRFSTLAMRPEDLDLARPPLAAEALRQVLSSFK